MDLDSLAELVEHYEAIGTTGLTVLGVFGEAAALTPGERRDVLETVVESTSLPLVVGVTALATRPAIEEVMAAQAVAGPRLAAVMVQANSARPEVVTAHLDAIHRATGANVVLQDAAFTRTLAAAFERALAVSREVTAPPLDDRAAGPVVITLPATRCTPPVIGQLKEVLRTHPGVTEVRLRLMTKDKTTTMRLPDQLRVSSTGALVADQTS